MEKARSQWQLRETHRSDAAFDRPKMQGEEMIRELAEHMKWMGND
jgi:hypothetical protein